MVKYIVILCFVLLNSCDNSFFYKNKTQANKFLFIQPIDSLVSTYIDSYPNYKNLALFVDIKNDLRYTISIVPFLNSNIDSLNKIYYCNYYYHNGCNIYIYSGLEKIFKGKNLEKSLTDTLLTGEYKGWSLLFSELYFTNGWLYENFADTSYIVKGYAYPYLELTRLPKNDSFFNIKNKKN